MITVTRMDANPYLYGLIGNTLWRGQFTPYFLRLTLESLHPQPRKFRKHRKSKRRY